MDANELIPPGEVAARLGVTVQTVLRWHQAGRLPALRCSRKVIRFSWPAVLAAATQAGAGRTLDQSSEGGGHGVASP